MKKLIITAFLFGLVGQIYAEELTVFVREGLVLRDAPNLKSKKIAIIPFGKTVSVQKASVGDQITINGITHNFSEIIFGKLKGYVFRGFLSRFPPPKRHVTTVEEYFKLNFGPGKLEKLNADPEAAETKKEQIILNDGIKIITTIYLGGGYSEIEMPDNFEIREIYLLFVSIEDTFKTVKFDSSDPNAFKCKVFLEHPADQVGPEMSFHIERKQGKIVILSGGQT